MGLSLVVERVGGLMGVGGSLVIRYLSWFGLLDLVMSYLAWP